MTTETTPDPEDRKRAEALARRMMCDFGPTDIAAILAAFAEVGRLRRLLESAAIEIMACIESDVAEIRKGGDLGHWLTTIERHARVVAQDLGTLAAAATAQPPLAEPSPPTPQASETPSAEVAADLESEEAAHMETIKRWSAQASDLEALRRELAEWGDWKNGTVIGDDPATDSLEQLRAWVKAEKAKCAADGSIFDTGFRCVSEGGTLFAFDPESVERALDDRDAALDAIATLREEVKRRDKALAAVEAAVEKLEKHAAAARKSCNCDWCVTLREVAAAAARVRSAMSPPKAPLSPPQASTTTQGGEG